MSKKIQTTHVGSLPRTPELLEANSRRAEDAISTEEFNEVLQDSIDRVVKRQVDLGIDIPNEGEYGHITSGKVDYGAWWNYSFYRLGGLTMTDEDRWASAEVQRSEPGNIKLTSFTDRRDRELFREAYEDPTSGVLGARNKVANPKFTGPITYIGQDQVTTDVNALNTALGKTNVSSGFMASLSLGSAARLKNEYYANDNEVVQACADAMHHEYKAITDAGLTVQLDAPDLAESWDQINPEPSMDDYLEWLKVRVDAINSALDGLPVEQTRLHICWGSWHGPHTTDVPLEAIIDVILEAKVGGLSFEGSSPRHAHEWRVWQNRELPNGYKLYPGLISHSTNAVEHPRLIADRIIQYAELVGPENVIASSDCGLGGRLHQQIAWAKLESLVEGARIASEELF